MPTQFSRAMEELGIQMIFALSPQAKGRVERTAGTFQDRLVPSHRVPSDTQLSCNPPDGTARPFHLVDLFHVSHL